jgi:hypothetical protein
MSEGPPQFHEHTAFPLAQILMIAIDNRLDCQNQCQTVGTKSCTSLDLYSIYVFSYGTSPISLDAITSQLISKLERVRVASRAGIGSLRKNVCLSFNHTLHDFVDLVGELVVRRDQFRVLQERLLVVGPRSDGEAHREDEWQFLDAHGLHLEGVVHQRNVKSGTLLAILISSIFHLIIASGELVLYFHWR